MRSPALNELAYRPDGGTGFNTSLQPQTSLQLELGAKWRDDAMVLAVEAALFRADTDDEIGVLTNAGARSTFQNVAAPGAAAPSWACAGSRTPSGARCWP